MERWSTSQKQVAHALLSASLGCTHNRHLACGALHASQTSRLLGELGKCCSETRALSESTIVRYSGIHEPLGISLSQRWGRSAGRIASKRDTHHSMCAISRAACVSAIPPGSVARCRSMSSRFPTYLASTHKKHICQPESETPRLGTSGR